MMSAESATVGLEDLGEADGLGLRTTLLRLCHSLQLPLKVLVAALYSLRAFTEHTTLPAELPPRSFMTHYTVACVYLAAKVHGHATTTKLPQYSAIEAANSALRAEDLRSAEKTLFLGVRDICGANTVLDHIKLSFASWFEFSKSNCASMLFRSAAFLLLHCLLLHEEIFECNLTLLPHALASCVLKAMAREAHGTKQAKRLNELRRAVFRSCKIGSVELIEAEAARLEGMYAQKSELAETEETRGLLRLYFREQFRERKTVESSAQSSSEGCPRPLLDIEQAEQIASGSIPG